MIRGIETHYSCVETNVGLGEAVSNEIFFAS